MRCKVINLHDRIKGGSGGGNGGGDDSGDNKGPIKLDNTQTPVRKPFKGVGVMVCAAVIVTSAAIVLTRLAPRITPPAERSISGLLSTTKKQHSCWELPDFSTVCLREGSSVEYTYSRHARKLEVIAGEAVFTVQNDVRPFEVLSGGVLLRDLSTQFDVKKRLSSITVTVVDGRVKLQAPINDRTRQEFALAEPGSGWDGARLLHRLDQVEFDGDTGVMRAHPALTEKRLSQLLAWQGSPLDLNGKSLDESFAALSRSWPAEKFVILGEELRQSRDVGGEMDPTNLKGFLDMLTHVYGIQHTVSRTADGHSVVILSRPQNPGPHFHAE